MTQPNYGSNWQSSFRDFIKSLQQMANNPFFSFTSHNSITEVNIERGVFVFINCNVLVYFTIWIIMGHAKELTDNGGLAKGLWCSTSLSNIFIFTCGLKLKLCLVVAAILEFRSTWEKNHFVNDYLMSIHTYLGSISSVVSEETFIHLLHIVQCQNYILQWWPFWIWTKNIFGRGPP